MKRIENILNCQKMVILRKIKIIEILIGNFKKKYKKEIFGKNIKLYTKAAKNKL